VKHAQNSTVGWKCTELALLPLQKTEKKINALSLTDNGLAHGGHGEVTDQQRDSRERSACSAHRRTHTHAASNGVATARRSRGGGRGRHSQKKKLVAHECWRARPPAVPPTPTTSRTGVATLPGHFPGSSATYGRAGSGRVSLLLSSEH
jgi:hypothetical protein